jgi:cyclomaltodextrinase / maltogenic alpha-amylase / neopullulanase
MFYLTEIRWERVYLQIGKVMNKLHEIKLVYTPPTSGEHKVFVAGNFSDWQQLEMKEESGNYAITLQLTAGKYPYKFIVDGRWITDPNAVSFDNDYMGGSNSLLDVKSSFEPLFIVPVQFEPNRIVLKTIAFSGDFINWKTDKIIMNKIGKDLYEKVLLLPAGEYEYKFILNFKDWITDPANPDKVSDDHDGFNSLLKVDEKFELYDSSQELIFTYNLIDKHYPIGETIGNDLVRFACRTYKRNIDSAFVIYNETKHKMTKFFSDNWYDYYSIVLPEKPTETFLINLDKGGDTVALKHPNSFKIKANGSDLDWAQNGNFYQIFCDRFCNGDVKLNPDFSEWYYDPKQNPLAPEVQAKMYRFEKNWNNYEILKDDPNKHFTFYGGDLVGVIQKIPYLLDLGINCIYFNPLVKSASNHKYDTFDYMQVDEHFGGNSIFKELVQECHKAGIKVIVDFAFNHVGTGFFAFQDCLKNGKKSKYFNWFDWYKWPLPESIDNSFVASEFYQCWWGHSTLPDLNFDLSRLHPEENYLHNEKDAEVNLPLVDHILKAAEFWLQNMEIDGFRLDVPNEVPFWFWKLFRAKVKSLKSDAYLVGEIWHNASEWIGKYFDGVMNYSYFREPVLQFFALQNWTKQQFLQEMIKGLHNYGFYNLSLMMNLISSHDTYRFLEACDGDIKRMKLALLFQFSWIGIPHIYYGDEVGMEGGNDPDNRRPMNWNYTKDADLKNLHDFVMKLASIRKDNPALVYGNLKIKDNSSDLIVLERHLANEHILVILNPSSVDKSFSIDTIKNWEVLIDSGECKLDINSRLLEISPFAGTMLKAKC